jgi:hypothetical protein
VIHPRPLFREEGAGISYSSIPRLGHAFLFHFFLPGSHWGQKPTFRLKTLTEIENKD